MRKKTSTHLTMIGMLSTIFLRPSLALSALPAVKPEAEAIGEKAPIQLTLRLLHKKIKAGDSLWVQLELKNSGKSDICITDDTFFKPGYLRDQGPTKSGIYLEVSDAAGKPVPPRLWPATAPGLHPSSKLADVDPAEDAKVNVLIEGWKKEGLAPRQIDDKLLEYSRERTRTRREQRDCEIAPGRSVATPRWAHSERPSGSDDPETTPIGQFSELRYWFDKPGKYRVRAVYDYRMSARLRKTLTPNETNVLVRTEPIVIEVVR